MGDWTDRAPRATGKRMSRRTKSLAIVCTATVLGLATAFAYLGRPYPPGPGITWENAGRINQGMSRTEVENLLGCKSQVAIPSPWPYLDRAPQNCTLLEVWSGRDLDVCVYFDARGVVLDREFSGGEESPPRDPNWWERAYRRLQ
jgi:hypothetical protein